MYVLGSTYLDTEKQLLVTAEGTVPLQRKPYLVLLHLIENRHRMITREELLERFWDGQEVYDQSVSKAIGSIRKAFGETKESSKFIETRWGGGYRYVGPFTEGTVGESSEPKAAVNEVAEPPLGLEFGGGEANDNRATDPAVSEPASIDVSSGKSRGRIFRVYLAAAVVIAGAVLAVIGMERWKHPSGTEGAAAEE